MSASTLAPSPQDSTARQSRVWLRPTGLSWKVRTQDEATAQRLRSALRTEGCTCTNLAPIETTTPFFFTRPAAHHPDDFIADFVRSQPDLILLHDPA